MAGTRKLVAILVADIVGYSRLAEADEERTLARIRGLRSDLIDPAIDAHHGRIVKRTGDGSLIEFRSVVDAVRCAIEVQSGSAERNAGLPPERRIEFRVGIHLGDVVEEADGDLMGDGVNIAARLEGVAKPGGICLSEDAYRQVKSRLELRVHDLGVVSLKNITQSVRAYALEVGPAAQFTPIKAAFPTRRRLWLAGLGATGILAVAALAILRPFDWYFVHRGESEFLAGRAKEAIESYGRAQTLNLKSQVILIASYAEAGMGAEASKRAQELLKKSPKFSVSEFIVQEPAMKDLDNAQAFKDALVSSGLPLHVRWECLARNTCP